MPVPSHSEYEFHRCNVKGKVPHLHGTPSFLCTELECCQSFSPPSLHSRNSRLAHGTRSHAIFRLLPTLPAPQIPASPSTRRHESSRRGQYLFRSVPRSLGKRGLSRDHSAETGTSVHILENAQNYYQGSGFSDADDNEHFGSIFRLVILIILILSI